MADKIKRISLTRGKFTIVDESDFAFLSNYKWTASKKGKHWYAIRHDGSMARLLLNAPEYLQVDHIDGNSLDNRRQNLRLCTQAQNLVNLKKGGVQSKYKGVTPHQGKWRARISPNRRTVSLGCFPSEKEAAHAYDRAAVKYFGKFACTNEGLALNGY